ncbi:MAG: DUF1311 domain-containing protein [Bacteroidetes bacterium]|nr:DUF1311 domain-containing protein [Bacteroidota bacterium]
MIIISTKTKGQTSTERTKHPIEIKLERCLATDSNQSTSDMIQCTTIAIKEWDIELNKYYQLLMTILPLDDREKLKIAQRAWLSFYEKEKAFSSSLYSKFDGTMWRLIPKSDALEMIKTRAIELEQYYEMKLLNK